MDKTLTQQFIGKTVLITTNEWFHTPNGKQYRAVFGTLHAVLTSEESLGVKTNARSTNWYVAIGNMLIAGCQIYYVVKTDAYHDGPFIENAYHEGKATLIERECCIYNADAK